MSLRRLSVIAALVHALGGAAAGATQVIRGRDVLGDVFAMAPLPSFGMRYGSNPKAANGGTRSGAAAAKRSARKRRNVRMHPRGAA